MVNVLPLLFSIVCKTNSICTRFPIAYAIVISCQDVKQEKQHTELIQGVQSFDKEQGLKPTETDERIVLPNAEGLLTHHEFFATLHN